MLNHISEKRLRKTRKVRATNFSGGTSEKITDQLDDHIKGKPDDLIVLVGTKDIANNVNLLKNVKIIFRKVSKDSPSKQLAFSSTIIRKEKRIWKKSIIKTNARLKNYWSQKGLGYIENNKVKEVNLGKNRIQLIKKCNSVLAKNLLRQIERKEWSVLSIDVKSGNDCLSVTPERTNSDVYSNLENIRKNNSKKIIIANLNITSVRNKFDIFADIMKDNIAILMI